MRYEIIVGTRILGHGGTRREAYTVAEQIVPEPNGKPIKIWDSKERRWLTEDYDSATPAPMVQPTYRIEFEGDFVLLHHPEHGGIDIAKLIPNPLVKTPEWERLIHQMAAGPFLARWALVVCIAYESGHLAADATSPAILEAMGGLRAAVNAAEPGGREAPSAEFPAGFPPPPAGLGS